MIANYEWEYSEYSETKVCLQLFKSTWNYMRRIN